jgi:acetyl esterase
MFRWTSSQAFLTDGVGHGFFNKSPWKEKTLLRADEFLESLGYLKGKPTIKVP